MGPSERAQLHETDNLIEVISGEEVDKNTTMRQVAQRIFVTYLGFVDPDVRTASLAIVVREL
jgi:hypothetical protein